MTIDFQQGALISISDILKQDAAKLPHTKPLVGLIGGIGSGKSTVAAAFARRGGRVISADSFGHEALKRPDIRARIAERWGERALDDNGDVDRKKLGVIVFASPVERTNLELLVFPWIAGRIREEIAAAQHVSNLPFLVLDAAIMQEAGWNDVCDQVVYVHAPRELRLRRLRDGRGWDEEEVGRRESAQLPLSVKAMRADAAVDNSGSAINTQKQVDALLVGWGWVSRENARLD